jgi:hypothetical protein
MRSPTGVRRTAGEQVGYMILSSILVFTRYLSKYGIGAVGWDSIRETKEI